MNIKVVVQMLMVKCKMNMFIRQEEKIVDLKTGL